MGKKYWAAVILSGVVFVLGLVVLVILTSVISGLTDATYPGRVFIGLTVGALGAVPVHLAATTIYEKVLDWGGSE